MAIADYREPTIGHANGSKRTVAGGLVAHFACAYFNEVKSQIKLSVHKMLAVLRCCSVSAAHCRPPPPPLGSGAEVWEIIVPDALLHIGVGVEKL